MCAEEEHFYLHQKLQLLKNHSFKACVIYLAVPSAAHADVTVALYSHRHKVCLDSVCTVLVGQHSRLL